MLAQNVTKPKNQWNHSYNFLKTNSDYVSVQYTYTNFQLE